MLWDRFRVFWAVVCLCVVCIDSTCLCDIDGEFLWSLSGVFQAVDAVFVSFCSRSVSYICVVCFLMFL